jgi:hypothetical protein
VGHLLDSLAVLATQYGHHQFPLTFEDVEQAAGFLIYSTQVFDTAARAAAQV